MEKSIWNGKAHAINAASIFVYKSNRKNSVCELISVNHLINHAEDRKISDERIMQQFAGTLEGVIHHSLRFNRHLELSVYLTQGKDTSDGNWEDIHYDWHRVQFDTVYNVVQFLYSMYCLIYPYNTLDYKKDVVTNPSVKYWIKKYNNPAT